MYQVAALYNSSGQYALARRVLKKALETTLRHSVALRELGFTELLDGHPAEARAIFEAHPEDWIRDLGTALAEYSLGNEAASKTALARLASETGTYAHYQIAEGHAWRGERDAAFESLEQARLTRDPGIRYIKYDPFLRNLRGDPRYATLLASLNLPPG